MASEEKIQKSTVNCWDLEEPGMSFWAPLLHFHDVGRKQHLIETDISWNKIQKLHKAASRLQCNWDLVIKSK